MEGRQTNAPTNGHGFYPGWNVCDDLLAHFVTGREALCGKKLLRPSGEGGGRLYSWCEACVSLNKEKTE